MLQTGVTFPRIDAYKAVQAVRQYELARQGNGGGGGGTPKGDPNGSIGGAVNVPALTGNLLPDPDHPGQYLPYEQSLHGTIGVDGGTIQVGPTDVDVFRFQTAYDGNVTIRTLPRDDVNVDTVLRLFDATGHQIDANDNDTGGNTGYSRLDHFLQAGTYYVGVSGAANDHYDPNDAGSGTAGSLGDYSITFDLNNGDTNGLLSSAVAVPSLPAGYPGNIGYDYGRPDGGADVDLFKVVAPDNGWMTAATITNDDSGYCDTLVRAWLVNADGSLKLLGSNDDKDPSAPTAGQGHSTDSDLRIHVLQGQTILFGVADYKNEGYDPTNLANRIAGDGGTYSLQLDFSNADLNGNIAHARSDINLGDTFAGVIGGDGFLDGNGQPGLVSVGSRDVDVFRFVPTQTGVLEIDTQGQQFVLHAGSTYVDDFGTSTVLTQDMTFEAVGTTIRVFDADGKPLATSVDSGTSLSSVVQVKVNANSTYYVGISAAGDNNYDPTVQGSGSPGPEGSYTAQAKMLSEQRSVVILNEDVVSTPATPPPNEQPIAAAQAVAGTIGLDGSFFRGPTDYDPYAFTTSQPGLIDVVVVPRGESGLNPYLQVFDASGHRIAANDNANASTSASELVFPAFAGQSYHIVVSGHGNQSFDLQGHNQAPGSTGDYALSVRALPTAVFQLSASTYTRRRLHGRRHDRRGPHRLALRYGHGQLLDRWRFGRPGSRLPARQRLAGFRTGRFVQDLHRDGPQSHGRPWGPAIVDRAREPIAGRHPGRRKRRDTVHPRGRTTDPGEQPSAPQRPVARTEFQPQGRQAACAPARRPGRRQPGCEACGLYPGLGRQRPSVRHPRRPHPTNRHRGVKRHERPGHAHARQTDQAHSTLPPDGPRRPERPAAGWRELPGALRPPPRSLPGKGKSAKGKRAAAPAIRDHGARVAPTPARQAAPRFEVAR